MTIFHAMNTITAVALCGAKIDGISSDRAGSHYSTNCPVCEQLVKRIDRNRKKYGGKW